MSNAKTKKKTATKSVPHVIVRTQSAGVFAGVLKEHDRKTAHAVIQQARRLWYWDGAASLSQLAIDGVSKPQNCKFPEAVASLTVGGVIEIIPMTSKAVDCIAAIPAWRATQ